MLEKETEENVFFVKKRVSFGCVDSKSHKWNKWIILLNFIVFLIVSLYFCLNLLPFNSTQYVNLWLHYSITNHKFIQCISMGHKHIQKNHSAHAIKFVIIRLTGTNQEHQINIYCFRFLSVFFLEMLYRSSRMKLVIKYN